MWMVFDYRRAALALGCLCFAIVVLASNASAADATACTCDIDNGLLSLQCEDRPILDVLDRIAKAAHMRIYLFDSPGTSQIQRNYIQEPIGDVLRSLLKECDHAVVYASRGAPGVRFVGGSDALQMGFRPEKSLSTRNYREDVAGPAEKGDSLVPNMGSERQDRLMRQVRDLEARIESGDSDRDYERWARIRGRQYVIHDRERLDLSQEQLGESGP
jgi:hypothetical protein